VDGNVCECTVIRIRGEGGGGRFTAEIRRNGEQRDASKALDSRVEDSKVSLLVLKELLVRAPTGASVPRAERTSPAVVCANGARRFLECGLLGRVSRVLLDVLQNDSQAQRDGALTSCDKLVEGDGVPQQLTVPSKASYLPLPLRLAVLAVQITNPFLLTQPSFAL
jgi:hypothetical protein